MSSRPGGGEEDEMHHERNGAETVELIEYTIVSIEPTREHILPEACCRCVLVTEDLGHCGLDTWLVARHVSRHDVDTPTKYLRVAHRVLGRWPRRSLYFEEKQLERLDGVRRAILSSLGGGETEEELAPVHSAHSTAPPRVPAVFWPSPSPPLRPSPAPAAPPPPPSETPHAASPAPAGPPPPAPPSAPDDLTAITGIGPKAAGVLQDAGITTFGRLAKTRVAALREILDRAGPRFRVVSPETWPEQARLRTGERKTEE